MSKSLKIPSGTYIEYGKLFSFLLKQIMLIFLIVPVCLCDAGEYSGNCFVAIGFQKPSDSFSEAFSIDTVPEVGISFDLSRKSWPVSFALESSYLYAKSSHSSFHGGEDILFVRSDLGVGIKKYIPVSDLIELFVCGGIYMVQGYSETGNHSDTTIGLGSFLTGGFKIKMTAQLSLGLQWKYSDVDLSFEHTELKSGGNHVQLLSGVSF